MAQVPEAPPPEDGPCTSTNNEYIYTQDDSGASYSLDYCIGADTGNVPEGTNTATPAGIHDN
jgi:hypothetical protein